MKFASIAATLLCLLGLSYPGLGCGAAAPPPHPHPHQPEGSGPWSTRGLADDPDDFQIVIVTDRTGGRRAGVFGDAVGKTQLMRPELVMSVGDLIDGYSEDPAQIQKEWDEFQALIEPLDMRFYYVPGNHDITNPVMAAEWKKRFGPTYYHFVHRNVLFLCLNTEEGAPSRLGDEQVAYARRVLDEHPEVRWTLVFMHKPLWVYEEGEEGRRELGRIEEKLRGRPHTVFAGHFHNYTKHVRNDQSYIVLATTGGGSQLRGPLYGEFDHVVWLTMTDQGPRIANLMLDGIHDENVRTAGDVELLAHIQRSISVRGLGTLVDGESFGGGGAAIELFNGSNVPARFDVAIGSSSELSVEPRTLKASVAAGATARLPIELKLDRPRPSDVPLAVGLEWSAHVEVRGKPFERHEHSELSVYRGRKLARQDLPVTVDGRLDEWKALAYDGRESIVFNDDKSWKGYRDLDYRFDVRVDDQYLYLAIDVTDDVIKVKPRAEPFSQDGIEILIDPRDDPERRDNVSPHADAWKRLADLSFSPAETPAEMAVARAKLIPEGVRYVAVPTARGYAAEVAIPHALLDAMRPHGPWQAIRLSLALFDSDEAFGQGTAMRWQPEWRSKGNRPGSGTFYRE